MKRSTLVSYVVLLMAVFGMTTAVGQGPRRGGDPEQMLDRRMSDLKERLSLTTEQEEQVRSIFKESLEKTAELRGKRRGDGSEPGRPSPEIREQMGKLREETTRRLAEVLSKEQMEKYEQWQQERRGRFGGGP